MARLLYTLGAIAICAGVAMSLTASVQPTRIEVIGNDKPVFLGSTVVTARPL
jgi:hypothetical protein